MAYSQLAEWVDEKLLPICQSNGLYVLLSVYLGKSIGHRRRTLRFEV